jgi:hypothetical protein
VLANEHFTSVINLVDTVLDIGFANCDLKVLWRVGIRDGARVVDVVDNDTSTVRAERSSSSRCSKLGKISELPMKFCIDALGKR